MHAHRRAPKTSGATRALARSTGIATDSLKESRLPMRCEHPMNEPDREPTMSTRQEELRSTLFLAVVMAPVLAVIVVAGYGFLVWMFQLVAGPPAY
jgi:nitrate reductase NapE